MSPFHMTICRIFFLASVSFFLATQPVLSQINPLAIPPTLSGPTYDLTLARSSHEFMNGIQTTTLGINGTYLGPTLILESGTDVQMNVTNQIGEPTTIHWHGMHVAPEDDGGPHTVIPDGTTWSPDFNVLDQATTFWYHPHLHERTGEHVYKGLAGVIIVRDAIEAGLNLPRTYGVNDIPVVLQDRQFNAQGQLVFNPGGAGQTGNQMVINGTLDPFVALEAGITRLRLLNGSNSRVYMLGLDNDADFHMIGSDGGLLSAPVAMNRLKLAPGERADVLFDLNGLEGQSRTLMSYSSELTQGEPGGVGGGGGPGGPNTNPLNGTDFDIMELRISGTSTLNSIPSSLVTVEPLNESDSDRSRPMLLNNVTGQGGPAPLAINGVELDLNVINEIVTLGDTEIWTITNQTGEPHPFHIHDIQFQILDRGGIAPPAHEQGWKDTVLVYPGEPVRIISRFEDHADPTTPYMYHCHFLGHEDGGMMGQFLVIDPNATTIEQELLPYGDFELMNYPDPFVDWTTIVYSLETISHVRIKVYDATGRALKTLFDGFRDAGRNESIWKAGSVPSGTYFIQIEVDGIPATKSVRITK
ncbi:MAG: multicopper oxidase domain-containing protein [Bacteroidetes Order II. Incertae sedis bacterium]|nr:multicopper oxidase domain-containing protein [Bacteroidetes Order II. bacterium]